ncbi:MAG: homoserine kinase [Actinomycetia bacterium]|nr:homoserine kinase [Actinomycetes bacterium]
MALSVYADVIFEPLLEVDAQLLDDHHPATVAFRRAGGEGPVWLRSSIPIGRGMGFSGAARVGGVVAAHAQRYGTDPDRLEQALPELLHLATELEGHADNVAASLYGGVVATAAGHAVRVPLALEPAMVLWVPSSATSTDDSRRGLPASVPFADAVHNIGRTALLVAALAAGDIGALRAATEDRIHQDLRLAHAEPSRAALLAALDAGAWAAWLSGSGPSVAVMCAVDEADAIAAALPSEGHSKLLRIDRRGALMLQRRDD